MRTTLALLVGLVVIGGAPGQAGEVITGSCLEVVDGDTIHVVSGGGEPLVVNLADIDAPELEQAYGEEAKQLLAGLVLNKEVRVEVRARDAAGEITGQVMVGEVWTAKALLEAGLAWTVDARDESLAVASIMGRGSQLGLWQDPDPVAPWTWRAQQVQPKQPTPQDRSLATQARAVDPSVGGPRRDGPGAPGAGAAAIPAPGTPGPVGPWVDFAVMCAADQIEVCARNAFVRFFPKVNSGDEAGEIAETRSGALKDTDLSGLPIPGTSKAGKPYAGWAAWPANATATCRVTVRVPKL